MGNKTGPDWGIKLDLDTNIAKTAILYFDACFPDSVVGFTPQTNEANSIYVHFLFKFFQRIIEKNAPQAAQKNINLELLRNLSVPKPPIDLQTHFAQIVENVEALKVHYQASLKGLENLYGSLSQRAFKGELDLSKMDVQVPKEIAEVVREKKAEEKVVKQFNKEIEDFHRSLPYSSAPADTDNTIRQLDTELQIRGVILFWPEYVKYRILKDKLKGRFSYVELRDALYSFPFEKKLTSEEIQEFILSLLECQPPFIEQIFDIPLSEKHKPVTEQEKQIMFRVINAN